MLTIEEVGGGEHHYSCETVLNTELKITEKFASVEGPNLLIETAPLVLTCHTSQVKGFRTKC